MSAYDDAELPTLAEALIGSVVIAKLIEGLQMVPAELLRGMVRVLEAGPGDILSGDLYKELREQGDEVLPILRALAATRELIVEAREKRGLPGEA